ncbi:hypothetical protein CMV_026901 [Castanea mollissima]|uniref:Uncharacterized protein n=1 Tax=Castanea mollissima TaxID=60419 RepID=A0A8J4QAI3_9ROSI|nr:hypothetical protein CMV_026901 [Castanea mollissima]
MHAPSFSICARAGENENWYMHQQRMAGLAFFSCASILLMLTAIIYIMQMVLIIPDQNARNVERKVGPSPPPAPMVAVGHMFPVFIRAPAPSPS